MESEIVARRAGDGLQAMLRTLARVAARIASFALIVGVATFATGLWIFQGSGRDKWIVIGGVISFAAPLAATIAAYRVRRTADLAPKFAGEVQQFNTVVKGVADVLLDGDTGQVAGLRAKSFTALRSELEGRRRDFPALTAGVRAVTTVPKLLGLALMTVMAAGALGTILLIGGLID